VAGGKRDALEPLLRRHATPLLTFIRRMVGDLAPQRGALQEAFLAVWAKRRQYQYPRPFKAWLYAIALNKCRAAFRHPSRPPRSRWRTALPRRPRMARPRRRPSPPKRPPFVAAAVTLLPPQQRAVVVLRVWEQLSYARSPTPVGCTEATARSHMHHGLCALRKYLEPRLG